MASNKMASLAERPSLVFGAAIALRAILLVYGAWQDAHSAVKYTDIDYMVFTDAARYVANGSSPYDRATYRYTPLLAWLLIPTSYPGSFFFSFGKILFALADVLAGWLMVRSLTGVYGLSRARALKYACVWLLNPMVANISTRGSSEGLLCVLVVALLWAVLGRRVVLAGGLLGLAVHFKIYPFVYGASVVWWMDGERMATSSASSSKPDEKSKSTEQSLLSKLLSFITIPRLTLTLTALATFTTLNLTMYILYSHPFLQNTYLHHLSRIDHRHNFSPYSTLLYLVSAGEVTGHFEALAFVPQLVLAVVVVPVVLAKRSLVGAMFVQTGVFVGFNKVCTSQYFLWYLVFLPFYLPFSRLRGQKFGLGMGVIGAWVAGQALWLQQGYNLEFLGLSAFVPGLYLAGLGFFAINAWILGVIVSDIGGLGV